MTEKDIIETIRSVDKKFCSEDGNLAEEATLTAKEYSILRYTAMGKWVEMHYENYWENSAGEV